MKEQYSPIITSHKPISFPWYHVMLEVGGFSAIAITILFPTILEVSLRPFPTPVFDCLQFVVNNVCVEGGGGGGVTLLPGSHVKLALLLLFTTTLEGSALRPYMVILFSWVSTAPS